MSSEISEIQDLAGLAKLTLAEVNGEIFRCETRLKITRSMAARRAYTDRIKWLEQFREKHHGIPRRLMIDI